MVIILSLPFHIAASKADPNKTDYLSLAKRGWNYEYRGSIRRQVPNLPASHILAKSMAARDVCLLGSDPHALTQETLETFRNLIGQIFGDVGALSGTVNTLTDCPQSSTVFIRLYERRIPFTEFNEDLQHLNKRFQIGMSDQQQQVLSPAQAVTFFGKTGQATHIILLQPNRHRITALQEQFFRSLMIEELYQTYSFGIDVFKVGRGGPFDSKLQESFVNLQNVSWISENYMNGLLSSNPHGLCDFDILMLHALQDVAATVEGSDEFISFVDKNFGRLVTAAQTFSRKPEFQSLMDRECTGLPIRLTAQ